MGVPAHGEGGALWLCASARDGSDREGVYARRSVCGWVYFHTLLCGADHPPPQGVGDGGGREGEAVRDGEVWDWRFAACGICLPFAVAGGPRTALLSPRFQLPTPTPQVCWPLVGWFSVVPAQFCTVSVAGLVLSLCVLTGSCGCPCALTLASF